MGEKLSYLRCEYGKSNYKDDFVGDRKRCTFLKIPVTDWHIA